MAFAGSGLGSPRQALHFLPVPRKNLRFSKPGNITFNHTSRTRLIGKFKHIQSLCDSAFADNQGQSVVGQGRVSVPDGGAIGLDPRNLRLANVLAQPGGDRGDGVRASDLELQKSEMPETPPPPHIRLLGRVPPARIAGIITATIICSAVVALTPEPAHIHRAKVVERNSCGRMYSI